MVVYAKWWCISTVPNDLSTVPFLSHTHGLKGKIAPWISSKTNLGNLYLMISFGVFQCFYIYIFRLSGLLDSINLSQFISVQSSCRQLLLIHLPGKPWNQSPFILYLFGNKSITPVVKCQIRELPFCHKSSAFFLRFGSSILKDAFLAICIGGVNGGTVENHQIIGNTICWRTPYKYISRICLLYYACTLVSAIIKSFNWKTIDSV